MRPQPPASSPVTVHADPTASTQPELDAKAKELEGKIPEIYTAGVKDNWPDGVSPRLSWAVKRVERWRAGDERPVVVRVRGDRKCVAMVGGANDVDGQIFQSAGGAQ